MISAANYENYVSSVFNIAKSSLADILGVLTATDYIFFGVILFLIILLIVLLFMFKNTDKTLEWEDRNNPASNDLLQIAREIEASDEQLNIELTNYEKEEENEAVISYEELVKRNKNRQISYSDIDESTDISIKKIDLITTNNNEVEEVVKDVNRRIVIMSYEKEEALLAALKQLQKNLS